jgi:hypothetical protein
MELEHAIGFSGNLRKCLFFHPNGRDIGIRDSVFKNLLPKVTWIDLQFTLLEDVSSLLIYLIRTTRYGAGAISEVPLSTRLTIDLTGFLTRAR